MSRCLNSIHACIWNCHFGKVGWRIDDKSFQARKICFPNSILRQKRRGKNSYTMPSHQMQSTLSVSELARLQILKAVKTQFYIHKSFDIQSDMEFMPSSQLDYEAMHIPTLGDYQQTSMYPNMMHHFPKAASSAIMPSPTMSPSVQYAMPDYSTSMEQQQQQQQPQQLYTPKTRHAYMSTSPKRTPTNGLSLRKRVVSGTSTPPPLHQPLHQVHHAAHSAQSPSHTHYGGGIHMIDPNQNKQPRQNYNQRNW